MGNLAKQSWQEILDSDVARKSREKVAQCRQNCWMVTTARTAMRSNIIPMFPKLQPLFWVLENKIKTTLGMDIAFDRYIDYGNVGTSPRVERTSFLNQTFKAKLQKAADPHYVQGEFFNR